MQAFGAKNYKMLGLVMQRATLLCMICAAPIVFMWHNVTPLLELLGLPPEVVTGTARYLMLLSPALFLNALAGVLGKYLMAQSSMMPNMLCTVVSALLCPVYNWVLITK